MNWFAVCLPEQCRECRDHGAGQDGEYVDQLSSLATCERVVGAFPTYLQTKGNHNVVCQSECADELESESSTFSDCYLEQQHFSARIQSYPSTATTELSAPARVGLSALKCLPRLPDVVVFDIDNTLWNVRAHETRGPPFRLQNTSQVSANGGDLITLFPDVPAIFNALESLGITVAVASHTPTPSWVEEILKLFQTDKGTSYHSLVVMKEMHEGAKSNHLRDIASKKMTGLERMVFFDDLRANLDQFHSTPLTCCHTPCGLSWANFMECLIRYSAVSAMVNQ